jgi:hypothetical protein
MRYFVRVNNQNQPVALYRLDLDTPKTISEQLWLNNSWSDSERIVEVLTQGSSDYDEITVEIAKQIFPEAFEELAKSIGSYEVSKAEGDKRYTLGAMYIPDRLDAHNEWTDAEELQRAVWDYVRSNDRRIRLQHNRDIVAGEWVEVMSFPYELTVPITTPSGIMVNHTYPANTVFLGVIWEEWAWEKIQLGEILGYSIGGRAERLYVDMEKNNPTATDVHVDTIMNPKKKKKVTDEAK